MFKTIVTFLILFNTVAFAAVSVDDVPRVYLKLVHANQIKQLPIIVAQDTYKYCGQNYVACYNEEAIIITYDILNEIKNEDELAGIIGHEMAHAKTGDELEADVIGLTYAAKAGYNYCKAAQLMRNWEADPEHPSGADRYKNTGC